MNFIMKLVNWLNLTEDKQDNVKSINPNIGDNFDFILDDPSVPLTEPVSVPSLPNPCPMFTLQCDKNDPQGKQVYASIVFTLNFVQQNLMQPLNRWSSTNNLMVYPRAGVQFNAYYDRANLKFFYDKAADGSIIYTCLSPDIVCHELGHGILDFVKPQLWSVQCLETAAFHESFGDTLAMLSALHHPAVINAMLKATDNDISKSNIVSRLAEQMGITINQLTGGRAGMSDALRNAVNAFTYVEPEKLPYSVNNDSQLCGECHSFSRVFTGAWYDALINMYNLEVKTADPTTALTTVRDAMTKILLRALPLASLTPRFYASVANAMGISAKTYGEKYVDCIKSAFVKRKIIKPDIKMLSAKNISDIKISNEDHVWKLGGSTIVKQTGVKTFKIPENHGIAALSANLAGVEIEIAHESYMEFDHHGNMVQELSITEDEAKEAAMFAVNQLALHDDIEYTDSINHNKTHGKTHAVVKGKLHRLYFN